MKVKSLILKEYFKNQNIQENGITNDLKLVIDKANMLTKNISTRAFKEEVELVKQDLQNVLDKNWNAVVFKDMIIDECKDMDNIMRKAGKYSKRMCIENSNIGNLDMYMSGLSGKSGKNYTLSEQQYIRKFEYNRENGVLTISAENLDVLSDLNRYKTPKLLKVEIYSKNDLKNIMKYIDDIRDMKLERNILVNKTGENNSDVYSYENYVNEKVVFFRSKLMKESIGLDKLPTKKINQTRYNIKIDGSKVDGSCIYVLDGEEETLFIEDLKDAGKYLNVAHIDYKNVAFRDEPAIKIALSEIESTVLGGEPITEEFEVTTRSMIEIIKEKLYKIFNVNFGFGRKYKALPDYTQK